MSSLSRPTKRARPSPPDWVHLEMMSGFGNEFASESLKGALPVGQNNPQRCPYGLFAEQLSGTAFTKPRHKNQRSWLYRIQPSVMHRPFARMPEPPRMVSDVTEMARNPNQMRWSPADIPDLAEDGRVDFVSGLITMAGAGEPAMKAGLAVHLYSMNSSMKSGRRVMCNADGDMLIVPQVGTLHVSTEFGRLRVEPCEIIVIQRGYVLEPLSCFCFSCSS